MFKCDVCVCSIICGLNQKDFFFIILYVFRNVFSSLFVFKICTYFIFQCFKLIFVLKNKGSESFASDMQVVHDLVASHETEKYIFLHFWSLDKDFHE